MQNKIRELEKHSVEDLEAEIKHLQQEKAAIKTNFETEYKCFAKNTEL